MMSAAKPGGPGDRSTIDTCMPSAARSFLRARLLGTLMRRAVERADMGRPGVPKAA